MDDNLAREGCQDQGLSIDRLENDRRDFRERLRLEYERSRWPKVYLLAEALREYPATFSQWMREDFGPGIKNMPADRIPAWVELAGSGLLRHLARRCGYDLIPRGASIPPGVHPGLANLLNAFSASAGAAVGQAVEDLSLHEHKPLSLEAWVDIQHSVNAIVEMLQRGRS